MAPGRPSSWRVAENRGEKVGHGSGGEGGIIFTRSAIFRLQIKPFMEDAFYAAVQERLLPAWQNMFHAQAVRLFRPGAHHHIIYQRV